jgi:uncharacterized protein with FMN-binding domain
MKKFFLSFSVIALFAIFAVFQRGSAFNVGVKTSTKSPSVALNTETPAQTTPAPTATPIESTPTKTVVPPPKKTTTTPTPTPTPAPKPTSLYKDGTFTGSVADAYYGNIQVQVVISGGKIADVIFLQYPNDRHTSVQINTQAMPYFKSQAIQAQSANVDGVSGATESSIAFQQSLASALAIAKN